MIIKTNDKKMITLYRKKYDEGILTGSQATKEALNDMDNTYIDIFESSVLGSELEDYLKPEVYEKIQKDYIEAYIYESLTPFEISAYEVLAEVIKVLSPEEVEKFARSARS